MPAQVGVVEMHEAFAGQVLSNFAAMNSDKFAADFLPNRTQKLGEMDFAKVNTQGRKRERNSQLQRLLSRPFSTRFG